MATVKTVNIEVNTKKGQKDVKDLEKSIGDVVANNITGYDVIKDDEFVETLGNDISGRTITGLDSGVTFKFGIRTRYTIGGTVFFSKDRIAFATTD